MNILLIINSMLFLTLLAALIFWGICELIWSMYELIWKIEDYLFQRDIEKHEE